MERKEVEDNGANTNQNGERKSGFKNKKLRNLFIKIVVIIVAAFIVVAAVFGSGLINARKRALENMNAAEDISGKILVVDPETGAETYVDVPAEETKVNIAVFGTDTDGYRTDVVFVLSYDTYNNKLALISIPRDTRVVMPEEVIQRMEENGRTIPYNENEKGACKFNGVHAYAGEGYRNEASVKTLESLLGIRIDGYINVSLEGFRNIVDAFGGVDMEVEGRLYYVDPYQDLYIDLYPGYQHLDGEHAEMLVRYREGYAQKDLKRIQVQQTFMKELMAKVMNTRNIMDKLPSIVYNLFKYVDTDLSLEKFVEYGSYMEKLSVNDVYMETIPGEGGSFFWADEEGLKELSQRVFYSHDISGEEKPAEEETAEETSAAVIPEGEARIEISNGSGKKGLGASEKGFIESKGFYVSFISTYTGENTQRTRIVYGSDEFADDAGVLAGYYDSVEVINDRNMLSTGTDIRIILGTDMNEASQL